MSHPSFKFPDKLPKKWLEALEKGGSIQLEEGELKVVGKDRRGVIVKTGRKSFKILHEGKNQNVFGNPLLPDWKNITVTEDANFVVVDNTDGFVFKFRKGTAGYDEIWLEGSQLIADERWVLEYLKTGQWRQRGDPQSVTWEQPQPYHVTVKRFYRDFESPETSFYVVWDFYGGFRPKISVEATIGQGDTYRLRWSVSGVNKNNFSDETSKRRIRLWNLDEKAVVLDYTDVYEQLGDITSVDSSEWAGGKKLTLSFNVGALAVGGFRLDPNFGYETAGTAGSRSMSNVIVGSVFPCPEAGTAQSITAYIGSTGPGGEIYVKFAIYKHSDLSFVAVMAQKTYNLGFVPTWVTFSFSTPPTLSATNYILVGWQGTSGTTRTMNLYYDAGDANQGHYQSLAYGVFPDPLNPTHEDRKYSVYCTYTAAAAAGGLKMIPSLKGHMGYDLKTRGGKARRRMF